MLTSLCRPHRQPPSTAVLLALLSVLSVATVAGARQDAAGLSQAIVSTTSALSPDQLDRVRSFVNNWSGGLRTGDPTQVARARNELAQPPGRPGATPAFHREYAGILRPVLEPIITGDDEFRAINALIVLRSLRTPEAVERLVALTTPRVEQRPTVRIRAAGLLAEAILDTPLNPAQVDGITRAVGDAAATDAEWVASYHGFRTLVRIAALRGLPPGSVNVALQAQADLMRRLVERAERESPPSVAVNAIARALLVARDQLPSLSPENAATLRRGMTGPLVRFVQLADAHWESARSVASAEKTYADALAAANLLLRLEASARNRPLSIDLGAKWRANDRPGFQADVAAVAAMASRS